jgi:type IV secretory pathway VirB3-like protein
MLLIRTFLFLGSSNSLLLFIISILYLYNYIINLDNIPFLFKYIRRAQKLKKGTTIKIRDRN